MDSCTWGTRASFAACRIDLTRSKTSPFAMHCRATEASADEPRRNIEGSGRLRVGELTGRECMSLLYLYYMFQPHLIEPWARGMVSLLGFGECTTHACHMTGEL